MYTAAAKGKKVWLRLIGLILGMGVLVWLPVEESSELGVLLISGLICSWFAVWIISRIAQGGRYVFLRHVLVWTGAGLVLPPLAIMLMAFKTGIHGHGTPEFTVMQMQEVLSRIPYFVLAGFLVGIGSAMWNLGRQPVSQQEA